MDSGESETNEFDYPNTYDLDNVVYIKKETYKEIRHQEEERAFKNRRPQTPRDNN